MGKTITKKEALFKTGKKLGSGFFSTVYKLGNGNIFKKIKTEEITASLKISKNDIRKMALKESRLQNSLSHNNILKCFGLEEKPLGLYLEDIDGISLTKYLAKNKTVDINKRISIAKMLANGVAYMHKEKIAHGDLKTDNIIVSQNAEKVKIADFGVAVSQKHGETFELQDYQYALYDDIGVCPDKIDIIQLGLMLKTIFSDFFKDIDDKEIRYKFNNKENQDMVNLTNIRDRAYEDGVANIVKLIEKEKSFSRPAILFLENTPKEIESLVNDCISSNPSQRLDADHIVGVLSKY